MTSFEAVRSGVRHTRHDLAHQMATVRALVDTAADPDLDPAHRSRVLAAVRDELGLATELVAGLAGEPAVQLTRQWTDLCVVARAAAAAHPDHRVSARAPRTAAVGLGRTATLRIVRNLLGNALAASGPAGAVQLEVVVQERAGSALVVLEVHDDGPGPGPGGFHRSGGSGLDIVRSLLLPAGGWLTLGRSARGGGLATAAFPGAAA